MVPEGDHPPKFWEKGQIRSPPNILGVCPPVMELGQVQAQVPDPYTHTSNFDSANIFLRQLPGGPDGPDPHEAILGTLCASGWS